MENLDARAVIRMELQESLWVGIFLAVIMISTLN